MINGKCSDCVYRWKMYSSQTTPYCGYTLDTGRLRKCVADECHSFVLGNPDRRTKIIFSENYFRV